MLSRPFSIFYFLAAFLIPLSVAAQTSTLSLPVERPRLRNELRLQNSQYVSQNRNFYRQGAGDSNRSIALSLDDRLNWRAFRFQISGKNEFSATENWNYADVYDLHADWRVGSGTTLSLGRKLDRWTEWESEWRQGVFQPRYLENKLHPESAGLTGLFVTQRSEPASFTLGFLPVHVPEFGPHFFVDSDKFVSKNPWFNPPASQFFFQDVPGDLRYSVKTPDTTEVIRHMGGVAKFEFAHGDYFARVSAAYKPAPQFVLGFPSRNRFAINYMSIEITPRVMYQRVVSLDQIVRLGAWQLGAGFTYENPEDVVPETFTTQTVQAASIYSLSASRALEEEGLYAARLRFGFLKIVGGDARDQGQFAQGAGKTLFERRYQYSEAYLAGVTKAWRGIGKFPVDTGVKLVFDRLQNGGLVSMNCGVNLSKEFRADLEMDYLGLFEGPARIDDGFFAEYRANDRVGLGLSYVY